MNKVTRLLAVAGATGALALSGGGIAAAATNAGSPQQSPDRVTSVAMKDHNGSGKDHSKGKDHGNSKDRAKSHDRNSKR
jgi:hypothetical protein